jgi:ribosome modulation factor
MREHLTQGGAMHRTLVATDAGFEAGRAGEPVDTNPYTGTDLERFWLTGHASGAEIREIEIEAKVIAITPRKRAA